MECLNNKYYFVKNYECYVVENKSKGLKLVKNYFTDQWEYINITKNVEIYDNLLEMKKKHAELFI